MAKPMSGVPCFWGEVRAGGRAGYCRRFGSTLLARMLKAALLDAVLRMRLGIRFTGRSRLGERAPWLVW